MPKKAKSLLHKYLIEEVKTKRQCGHFGTTMKAGELCLVIKEGTRRSRSYSTEAVIKMIAQARLDLDDLENSFGI